MNGLYIMLHLVAVLTMESNILQEKANSLKCCHNNLGVTDVILTRQSSSHYK